MLILIGTRRMFAKVLEQRFYVCPHRRHWHPIARVKYAVFLALFFIPVFPITSIVDHHCVACGLRVVPNEGGRHWRLIWWRNLGCAAFALFIAFWLGSWIIWVPSEFDPNAKPFVRGFLGMFVLLGLIVAFFALRQNVRLSNHAHAVTPFQPHQLEAIHAALTQGRPLNEVQLDWFQENASNQDIQERLAQEITERITKSGLDATVAVTYLNFWAKPEIDQ